MQERILFGGTPPLSRVASMMRAAPLAAALLTTIGCGGGAEPAGDERVSVTEQAVTCVTVQNFGPNTTNVDDAQVVTDPSDPIKASTNYGSVTQMIAGSLGTDYRRIVMKFDLAGGGVPANAVISSATLTIRMLQSIGKNPVDVYAGTGLWTESRVNWNLLSGLPNADMGAFEATVATQGLPNNSVLRIPISAATAQSWLDPATNFGVLFDHPTQGRTTFGSSEAGPAGRPTLEVCYGVATCSDGAQNQGETGVDCGGPCGACATCNDGVQNQGETGVDCGGPCGACATCNDGVQNQGEAGVDCGGPCAACVPVCPNPLPDDGNPCTVAACDAQGVVTQDPVAAGTSCSDGDPLNGAEICDGLAHCLSAAPPSGCDAACSVRMSGRVTFSDGAPGAGAIVLISVNGSQFSTVADQNGNYTIVTAPASYAIDVIFQAPGFNTQGRTGGSVVLDHDLLRDIVVPILTLTGHVVDDSGALVAGANVHGIAFAQNSCCGGFDSLSITSAQDGSIYARLPPNQYLNFAITPPPGSGLVETSVPNPSFTVDTSVDFVVQHAKVLSGTVRDAHAAPVPGAQVILRSQFGTQLSATADNAGHYSVSLAPDTYTADVAFSNGAFSTQGISASSAFAFTQTGVRDFTIPTIVLSGRVIDGQGNVVPGAQVHGIAFAQNTCCGGFDSLFATAGADGLFAVTMLPNNYVQLAITPPGGSSYIETAVLNRSFTTDTTRDFVIQQAKHLSGVVRFSDGTPVTSGEVIATSATGVQTHASLGAQGAYSMFVAPDTQNLDVAFSTPGFSTQGTAGPTVVVAQDTVQDINLASITLQGFIVDGVGTHVPGIAFHGIAFANNTCCGGFHNLNFVSDANGAFQVRMMGGGYLNMQLTPPDENTYVSTPLPNQTFTTDTAQSYVIVTQAP